MPQVASTALVMATWNIRSRKVTIKTKNEGPSLSFLERMYQVASTGQVCRFQGKNGSGSLSVENLNRSQETKRKSSKEADPSYIIAFNPCRSTESDQDPQKSSRFQVIYYYQGDRAVM
jgi:hypothetical protein